MDDKFTPEIISGIKEAQKQMVAELDRICQKFNLRYFLAYGTLLGAIRHDGFIPWDDDIDVWMPYPDMIKFGKICKSELSDEFFYQSPETDLQYGLSINRLRKNNTTLLEKGFVGKDVHCGIFLDIYPLFGSAPKRFARKIQTFRAMKRALYLLGEPVKNHGKLMRFGSGFLLALKSKKGADASQKKLFKKISRYPYDESERVAALDSCLAQMKRDYEAKWFSGYEYHKFDNLSLRIPVDSDKVLTHIYGDYMQLPPVEKRCYHHDFIDVSLSEGVEKTNK